ncbi:hypothetical protein TanjilG_04118 [Lupinus angustifolius]|uniref:S-protein homolog n=1 Tax=Lupinus angustifolius TaxID=3871 RepID=A0A4P1RJT4_LUPAN|nr:hypothetical protein TanjilG_04118 [Lupinus angustifolius]
MDGVESIRIIPRANVGITNKIPNLQLSFHCKDKYRDNGFHTLAPGESYNFGFAISPFFINRTQWFCLFSWEGESHYFNIYIEIRDSCKNCEWIIQKKGPCKNLGPPDSYTCFTWDDKEQHKLQGRKRLLISNITTQQEPPLALQPLNS